MMERYDFQNCFPRGHKSVKLARQLNAALNLIGGKEKRLTPAEIPWFIFVVTSGIQRQL